MLMNQNYLSLLALVEREDLPALADLFFRDKHILEALAVYAGCASLGKAGQYSDQVNKCKQLLGAAFAASKTCQPAMASTAWSDARVRDLAAMTEGHKAYNDIALYSVNIGSTDAILEPESKEAGIDYYYFTDNNVKSDVYNVIQVKDVFNNPRITSRCIKILPHIFLKQYPVSIYIDGSILLRGKPVGDILRQQLADVDLLAHKHRDRDCVYAEAQACLQWAREDQSRIAAMKKIFYLFNVPEHIGLVESGTLFRKNNYEMNIFNELWWLFVQNISGRDQLSFALLKYFLNLSYKYLPYSVWNNQFSRSNNHKMYAPSPQDPDIDIVISADHAGANLKDCLGFCLAKTSYPKFRLIIFRAGKLFNVMVTRDSGGAFSQLKLCGSLACGSGALGLAARALLQVSGAAYILLMDCAIKPVNADWLGQLVRRMEKDKAIGVVAPVMISGDYKVISAGYTFGPGTGVKVIRHNKAPQPAYVDGVNGGCFLIRRSLLEAEPDLWLPATFAQDSVSFCAKVGELGFRLYVCNEAEALNAKES